MDSGRAPSERVTVLATLEIYGELKAVRKFLFWPAWILLGVIVFSAISMFTSI